MLWLDYFTAQLDKIQELSAASVVSTQFAAISAAQDEEGNFKLKKALNQMWAVSGDLPSKPLDLTSASPLKLFCLMFWQGSVPHKQLCIVTSLLSHSPAGSDTFPAGHSCTSLRTKVLFRPYKIYFGDCLRSDSFCSLCSGTPGACFALLLRGKKRKKHLV